MPADEGDERVMATCADCVHVEVCIDSVINYVGLKGDTPINALEREVGDYPCCKFKDRSRFVELPCAEWVEDEDMYSEPIYRCSNCHERFVLEEGTPFDNRYFYCPNCGAKFETEQALKEREDNV